MSAIEKLLFSLVLWVIDYLRSPEGDALYQKLLVVLETEVEAYEASQSGQSAPASASAPINTTAAAGNVPAARRAVKSSVPTE